MQKKLMILFISAVLIFSFAAIAIGADTVETVTFAWDQEDRTLLEKWEMHWGDTSGGAYIPLADLAYGGQDQGDFESYITMTIVGDPGTTVIKYFVLRACGTTSEGYKCSGWSNMVSYSFDLPEGLPPPYEFTVPTRLRIIKDEPPPQPTSSNPLLMLHGLGGSPSAFNEIKAYLIANGFEQEMSSPAMVNNSAMCSLSHLDQIASQIASIKADTGAEKVDLLGYSRGGTASLAFMRFRNQGDDIGKVITIAGANNWNCNSVYGIPPTDQTPGNAIYTSIYSPNDGLVSIALSFLEDGATNISIDGVRHLQFPSNREVQAAVLEALQN